MAKIAKIDKETKKAILEARQVIDTVARADGNEAETRRRIERILESLMGYDVFKYVTREYAVHGVGDSDYCDFAIKIEEGEKAIPEMLVEIKRVNVDLAAKHLKQVASYAINIGCEWVVLTNGKEWKLYHISFGQPPQPKLIESWNLLTDEPTILADKFSIVAYKNVKKGGLRQLWQKSNVLSTQNILKAMLSEDSVALIRRKIKKSTDVAVSPEDIISTIRHLLNEAAISEMENIKICLPMEAKRKRVPAKKPLESNNNLLAPKQS